MFKELEQIDISDLSHEELRELAKDEFVYCLFNTFAHESKIFEEHGLNKPEFETCWRLRPLSYRVNDNKSDDEISAFVMAAMKSKFTTVVRMKIV